MPKPTQYKGSFRSVVDLSALMGSDKKLPKKIHVLPKGSYDTVPYGTLVLDEGVLTQMVANYENKTRKLVPVDVDHDGGKAAGWIEKLTTDDKGLWAEVDWTRYGKDLLENREYRLFSPEWSFDYLDPQHSTHHGSVLIAGSLTNRPLFKDLKTLKASESGVINAKDLTNDSGIVIIVGDEANNLQKDTMDIAKILAKKASERTKEELDFLASAELSDEQKKQVADEKTASDEAAKAEAKEKAEKEAKEAKEKAEAEAKKAKENTEDVTMKASEVAELKKAKEELDAMKAKENAIEMVKPLIASSKGGKILPKAQDKVVEFLLACDAEQQKSFVELMDSMPDIKIAGEKGDGEGDKLTAQEEIELLVKKAQEKDTELSASDAYMQVLKADENSQLVKRYESELKSE